MSMRLYTIGDGDQCALFIDGKRHKFEGSRYVALRHLDSPLIKFLLACVPDLEEVHVEPRALSNEDSLILDEPTVERRLGLIAEIHAKEAEAQAAIDRVKAIKKALDKP